MNGDDAARALGANGWLSLAALLAAVHLVDQPAFGQGERNVGMERTRRRDGEW